MTKLAPKQIYPLLFTPIYKEVMWGGNMLKSHLRRKTPEKKLPIGESWEIVDREGDVSVVENGSLKGMSLRELLEKHGKSVVGKDFTGGRFPLLVKLIDAGERLSLQVHPDDNVARQLPGAEPKTEMWYVVAAKPDARIFAGLSRSCTKIGFLDMLGSPDIENCLQVYESHPGDAYFINAGTVHAIGEGNLLLEIQQNSNTTYRLSDWGRVGADGAPRQLHVKEALACINFADRTSPRICGVTGETEHNRKFPIVKYCPHFLVDDLRLAEDWRDITDGKSFHLLTAVNAPVTVGNDEKSLKIPTGRTCLIPACFGTYKIVVNPARESIVIKTVL